MIKEKGIQRGKRLMGFSAQMRRGFAEFFRLQVSGRAGAIKKNDAVLFGTRMLKFIQK